MFYSFNFATTHDHFKQRYSNLKTKSKIHLKGFLDIRNQRDRNVEPKPAMSYVILNFNTTDYQINSQILYKSP
jgi:hypothetical protein